MAQGHMDRLSALDVSFLTNESSSAHMHVGGICIFEGPAMSYEDLLEHVRSRLHLVPRFRQKLAYPPAPTGRPFWIDDPAFNLEYHVRHSALPAPGSEEQLRNMAARVFSQQLDRTKPLWELWMVQGLTRKRFEFVTKTHHALVDGVGATDAATLLLDAARRPRRRPTATPGAEPDGGGSGGPLDRVAAGIRGGLSVIRHPGRLRDALVEAKAMTDILVRDELVPAPHCSLNVPIGARRRVRAVRADLAQIKAIKRELGGTVNDVILAAVTGGLRTLLLERNEPPPSAGLRAMVPVNMRSGAQRFGLGKGVVAKCEHRTFRPGIDLLHIGSPAQ
jgi:diacylglycerol O-acyltransferase / wax synthase